MSARDWALWCAARGWRVFPLHWIADPAAASCSCGDASCRSQGKHPLVADWQSQATADPRAVEHFFARWPMANYGIATGAASGVDVVDVDPDKCGSLEAVAAAAGEPLPRTPVVKTGSGGYHVYLGHADGQRNRSAFIPGVDVRGDGGYVVGPGCSHKSGRPYELVVDAPAARAPERLAEAMLRHAAATAVEGDWEPIAFATVEEFGRAFWACKRHVDAMPPGVEGQGGGPALLHVCRDIFRGFGLPDDAKTRIILQSYLDRCQPPWEDDREVEHKVSQGKDGSTDPEARGVGYLLAATTVGEALAEHAADAAAVKATIPTIQISTKQGEVTDKVVEAMAKRNGVYVRNDQLCAVYPGALPGEKKRVNPLNKDLVGELITRCCNLEKYDARQEDWVPANPPAWLIGQVYSRFVWPGIPTLTDFVDAPVLRADGTVVDKPGHDAATGVYYAPSFEALPVPEAPTLEECRAAADLLLDLVRDFPFSAPEHASAWIASLLTQFCRPMIKGPIPMVMIDGNNRGAGKTLLADIVSCVALGHTANKTPPSKDAEELRKQFSSAVLAGDTMLCLDNVVGEVGGPALDSALTNDGRWSDRILGGNTRVDKVVRMTVFATGNNMSLRDDLVRRLLYVRLDSPEERPEKREGFKYTLPDHALLARAELVRACLTILRGYWAAGRPDMRLPGWGSFASWSAAVRAPMVWCGLPDPAQGRKQLEEFVDEEPGKLLHLMDGLERLQEKLGGPFTASQVAAACSSLMPEDRSEVLREAVAAFIPSRSGNSASALQVGHLLKRFRNRPLRGKKISHSSVNAHDKVVVWCVAPI